MFVIVQWQFDIIDDINRYFKGAESEVKLEEHDISRWYPHEIEELVVEIGKKKYQPYSDAYFDPETEEIIPEQVGNQVLVEETVDSAMEAAEGTKVEVKEIPLYPLITEEFLSTIEEPLSGFSTGITGGGEGRITNIKISAQDINNTLIFPGQVFSFNRETLPRTWERGYRFAPIIVNGDALGIGGGICQVSTTVYNAALEADLEIIERHPHSLPVDYVAPGRDAAVAGDYLDMKFRNNTEEVLLLTASVSPGIITAEIYKSKEAFGPMSKYQVEPLAFFR